MVPRLGELVKSAMLEWELKWGPRILNIPKTMSRKLSFSAGRGRFMGLAVSSLGFPGSSLELNIPLMGILAAIPPFLFFLWTLKTRLHVFSQHKQLMESLLRPILGNWSLWQLFVI